MLAAALGCALAFVLAEAALRIADPPPRPLPSLELPSYRLSDDPILRYEYRRSIRASDEPINRGHRGLETNSHGFRDDEHPLAKPPGVYRIAVLGDSIAAGINNPKREALFSERLEARLNAGSAAGRYEVLNLGVGGYHTLQEAELLRTRGLAFDPDLVLLAFCINDFNPASDGGVYERLREADPGYDPARRARTALGRWLERSRLLFFAYHRARALLRPEPSQADYAQRFLGGRSTVEAGFELLARVEREHDLRVIVAVVPGFHGPFAEYAHREIHERVRAIAARHPELELIDLLDDFRRLDPDGRSFSNDGIHPHPAGHAALAAILHQKLRERGIGTPDGS